MTLNREPIGPKALLDRRQGKFEKAIQDFNEGIALDPHNSLSLYDLAVSLYVIRQFPALY